MEEKLVKLLYDEQLLSDEQYEKVQQEREASGERCDVILERLNILGEPELLAFLGKKFYLPVVDWDAFSPDEELLALLPKESAEKYMVFPLLKEQGKRQAQLTLAIADPSDIRVSDDIAFMTGCKIKTELASARAIREAIHRYYDGALVESEQDEAPSSVENAEAEDALPSSGISAVDSLVSSLVQQLKGEDDEPAAPPAELDRGHPSMKFLFDLLKLCAEHAYPELHIEPSGAQYTIRISQHGMLREHTKISAPIGQGIIMRLRRALQLPQKDSAPQSGAFATTLAGERPLQVQVHFYPAMLGEKIQLCLKNISALDTLEVLGIDEKAQKFLGRLIARPQGMLLLISPPRQGKTTSLYALLQKLSQSDGRILSLESSLERFLPKVSQTPFRSEFSYQEWCSFIAYQAPQILALDHPAEIELRARIAFEFAPGSLVLMTIAAADFASGMCRVLPQKDSVSRFSSMLDSMNGALSQRLIRELCPHCKKEASLSQQELLWLKKISASEGGLEHFAKYTASGCPECQETGYTGHIGLFEVIKFDKNFKQFLLQQQTGCAHHIRQYCADASLGSIREQALHILREGRSSLAEIRRALQR